MPDLIPHPAVGLWREENKMEVTTPISYAYGIEEMSLPLHNYNTTTWTEEFTCVLREVLIQMRLHYLLSKEVSLVHEKNYRTFQKERVSQNSSK